MKPSSKRRNSHGRFLPRSHRDVHRQLYYWVPVVTEANLKLAIVRSDALFNYYQAERRAGTCPLVANERMAEFAKRLDALYADKQAAVKFEMESVPCE